MKKSVLLLIVVILISGCIASRERPSSYGQPVLYVVLYTPTSNPLKIDVWCYDEDGSVINTTTIDVYFDDERAIKETDKIISTPIIEIVDDQMLERLFWKEEEIKYCKLRSSLRFRVEESYTGTILRNETIKCHVGRQLRDDYIFPNMLSGVRSEIYSIRNWCLK